MNIFVTDKDPYKCSAILDDLRNRKMIIETAQILSTCIYKNTVEFFEKNKNKLYKPTHINHPCVIWSTKSEGNYKWLLDYYKHLSARYYKNAQRIHKSSKLIGIFVEYKNLLKNDNMTNFVNCSAYKNYDNIFLAYKHTLIDKWRNDIDPPSWNKIKYKINSWEDIEKLI